MQKLFIAAPMSGTSADEYAAYRATIENVQTAVRASHKISDVYFAGSNVADATGFNHPLEALQQDVMALRASDVFMMIYPKPVVTGALVEAGVALERNMPMILMVKSANDLPWFLRHGHGTALSGLPTIRVMEFDQLNEMPRLAVEGLANLYQTK